MSLDPTRLNQMDMNVQDAEYNAAKIYENPNDIFVIKEGDRLATISKWNIFGRVFEWIRDKLSGGQRSFKAHSLVLETLLAIQQPQNIERGFYETKHRFMRKPDHHSYKDLILIIRSSEQLKTDPKILQLTESLDQKLRFTTKNNQ